MQNIDDHIIFSSYKHLIVVSELDHEVIRLRSVADHRLGPLPVVRPVAGGSAALLELLVPKHLIEVTKSLHELIAIAQYVSNLKWSYKFLLFSNARHFRSIEFY